MRLFLALILLSGPAIACDSIGIMNKNPGNLRPGNWRKLHGAIGVNGYGHAIFRTHELGLMACRDNIKAYGQRYKIHTLDGLIRRWIGPKNFNSKHGKSVVKNYRAILGPEISASKHLDLTDKATALLICHAIVRMENGCDPYPESMYARIFKGY